MNAQEAYAEAQRRIAEVTESDETRLHLGGLKEPPEIAELSQLNSLSLAEPKSAISVVLPNPLVC